MTNRKTMSIMELAYQILLDEEKAMTFVELYDRICEEKEIVEKEKLDKISQVYTDFITSAKFIYVGDEEWDIKGRQAIDLWDKDGAYYDEYPDYEEELSLYDEDKTPDEYSIEEDVETDEEEEEYIEDAEDLIFDEDEEEEEKEEEFEVEEKTEDFDDEEYNEYMDDYEQMYDD